MAAFAFNLKRVCIDLNFGLVIATTAHQPLPMRLENIVRPWSLNTVECRSVIWSLDLQHIPRTTRS
jgi:hypothetical protein